ncbi:hypothetical protein Tco_1338728 [Tanacetum coccineum]
MTHSGSDVFDDSSSGIGFNQFGLVLIFRRWAAPVSSDYERCISSGIRSSVTGCKDREAGFCLEKLEGGSLMLEVFQAEDF